MDDVRGYVCWGCVNVSSLRSFMRLSDSEGVALEYKLFKTYTEVQRMVETRALLPMVRLVHREEVYEQAASCGQAGIKVEVELDIEALLEYR